MLNLILQHRRGSTSEWNESVIVPKPGELVIEEQTNQPLRIKIGDGVHLFKDLQYIDDATVKKLDDLLARYNEHIAYVEGDEPVPDSTLATEVLDARVIDGVTYTSLNEAIQSVSDKHVSSLVYDYEGTLGIHQPYMLYLTDKSGNILEDTGVQIISGSGGGGGGGASSSTLKIERITPDPYIITINDTPEIKFIFSGVDSSDEVIAQANAKWKVDGVEVVNTFVKSGENTADYLGKFLSVGTHKVLLVVSDDAGTTVTKTWNVNIIDIRIESEFDDTQRFDTTHPITFTYTPYGAINKEIHFILDGTKLLPKTETTVSGATQGKSIPPQSHGSHYLEVFITAGIEKVPGEPPVIVESNHIYKDLLWYDFNSESVPPVIGTNVREITCKEYDTIPIEYTVYAESETPAVIITVTDAEGNEVSRITPQLTTPTNVYNFRCDKFGTYTIKFTCESTVKEITAHVNKLDIDIDPVTEGLAFDFNPSGISDNTLWSDGTVSMAVSDNFDWINGGYKLDEAATPYFCVKAGTYATFNYTELFSDTTKLSGRNFKVVFRTANIKKRDTSIITCRSAVNGVGLDMRVENANIYSSVDHLYSPYCEEDLIEFEYNINASSEIPLIMTYEDGVANRPLIYTDSSTLTQGNDAQVITVGSEYCDVCIYRMKAYNRSLSDKDILSNFILDASNSTEIVARYKRNQIYNINNVLDPIAFAEYCPDLRVIMIEAPRFTYDKDDKVPDTTIRMIYQNGRKVEDNWICTGAQHSGQGTSSNEYGYAGRNLDLIMNKDTSKFTLSDGSEASTITLTENSVPVNYLNVKVNIASSENTNNAQMANRYNKFNPFKRTAKLLNSKVKDCMEFYNCVIFIKETGPISEHQEFKDNEWHFYAIGNVGDSKKTDNTRVNDKNDWRECVVEIADWNLPLSDFPTGMPNNQVCPIDMWNSNNPAYRNLYAPYEYEIEDGEAEFKSFGNTTYEFRYEKKGITEEQRQQNIESWQKFYTFLVTSDDDYFKAHLEDYFVVDSALYYYLFTERYTMVDNRAKNSFWHYGKAYFTEEQAKHIPGLDSKYINNDKAQIDDGYRWDLCFGYDFDTSLGIDNVGKLTITYGKEDVDYYNDDPEQGYIYRAATSTFFTRVRDNFVSELQSMYVLCESAGAWSSTDLITQWDNAQNLFPEELWRLDIQRKYIRTYLGSSVDNSLEGDPTARFLTEMLNGRKRYQRRMFERNQELYMATKYFGNFATANNIYLRFNNPERYTEEFSPLFSMEITPYSDMYIGVSFANGSVPAHFRAKQGIKYTVDSPLDKGDITLIYGARFIQEIGNLSRCYIGDNDFSKATRLQQLILGDPSESYNNTFMTSLSLESNSILEELNIANLIALSKLDVSKCFNLRTIHAEGSGCKTVEFAKGGLVEQFYLPAVTALTIRDLRNLINYNVPSDSISELIVENTPRFDALTFTNSAITLTRIRITNIDWTLQTAQPLTRLLDLSGYDINGQPQNNSVVTGQAHIGSATGMDYKLLTDQYKELILTFDSLTSKVTFKDELDNVLAERTVYNPELAGTPVSPVGVTLKNIPDIIVSKVDPVGQFEYTQSGWTQIKGSSVEEPHVFDNILGDRIVYPRYIETVKNYRVSFYTLTKLIYQVTLPYGAEIRYSPTEALKYAEIGKVIDENGYPLKQDTGSPSMYNYVAFLPDIATVTKDTSLYADFVLSLDNIVPAVLSEFEYTQDDSLKTLSLNKYIAVENDEPSDSDSITTIPSTFEIYGDSYLGNYTVTSVGGFNPNLEDVTVDVEIVQLPETTEQIQDAAFLNCSKLLRAEIPENVTYLGVKAFSNCKSLEEVIFRATDVKNTITTTPDSPFYDSTSKNGFKLSIAENVKTIPAYLFSRVAPTSMIREITWEGKPSCKTINTSAFRNSTPPNMIIPDSVEEIGSSAFEGDTLHSVISYIDSDESTLKLSANLTHLGSNAFDNMPNLKKLQLPSTLKEIKGAFVKYCPSLTEIVIAPGSSRYLVSGNCIVDTQNQGRAVIQGCTSSVLLGGENGILSIADRAFEGSGICSPELPNTLLPDSLQRIGNYAFSHCYNLTHINIPNKVTSLPTQCFEHCTNLEQVDFHNNLQRLGTYLFWNCERLNNVVLPPMITAIPGGCFFGCAALENIQLPTSLLTIDTRAFAGTHVKFVTLPDSVTQLSTEAFSNCVHLQEFTFNKNIKKIGGSVTTQDETGVEPFKGCVNLKQINCPFAPDSSLSQTAPWGVTTPVKVVYNFGSDNEVIVNYNE